MNMLRRRLAILWLTVLSCGCGQSGFFVPDRVESARGPQIQLNTTGLVASFDLMGLSGLELAALTKLDHERQAEVFQVHVLGDLDDPPAMVGELSIVDQTLRFTPRYPLEPGLRYCATWRPSKLPSRNAADDVTADFEIPQAAIQPPTVVEHIYPSAGKLPENQLKFYLHFSAPMSRGEAYRHIRLLAADGQEVEGAFLELGEELWDRDQRRFTLLCDPGRVKRGLKPREELGPVLEEGKSYSLVIDRDWHDAMSSANGNLAKVVQRAPSRRCAGRSGRLENRTAGGRHACSPGRPLPRAARSRHARTRAGDRNERRRTSTRRD